MPNPAFPDIEPMPGEGMTPGPKHNRPPLEDSIGLDFDEAIRNRGLDQRIQEISESAGRAPDIETAGSRRPGRGPDRHGARRQGTSGGGARNA